MKLIIDKKEIDFVESIKIITAQGEYELWETVGGRLAVNTDNAETSNGNSYLNPPQDVVE